MSCGNRFQCGITRFQKHSFTPDKPSNVELHNENQKRLNDLLKAREDIDKQFLSANPTAAMTTNSNIDNITPQLLQNTIVTLTEKNTTYTPWSIPSTEYYQIKPK